MWLINSIHSSCQALQVLFLVGRTSALLGEFQSHAGRSGSLFATLLFQAFALPSDFLSAPRAKTETNGSASGGGSPSWRNIWSRTLSKVLLLLSCSPKKACKAVGDLLALKSRSDVLPGMLMRPLGKAFEPRANVGFPPALLLRPEPTPAASLLRREPPPSVEALRLICAARLCCPALLPSSAAGLPSSVQAVPLMHMRLPGNV